MSCCGKKRKALDPTRRTLASPVGALRTTAPPAPPAAPAIRPFRPTHTPTQETNHHGR